MIAAGEIVSNLLRAENGVNAATVYYGILDPQPQYPAISVTDFAISEDCKDGLQAWTYTVTCLCIADTQGKVMDLVGEVINRVDRQLVDYEDDAEILRNRTTGIGPWIWDEVRKKWNRPVDFEITVAW